MSLAKLCKGYDRAHARVFRELRAVLGREKEEFLK
jgi:hypothetical protein